MADVRCKECGAEYPEEWGQCQCITVNEKKTDKKADIKPVKK